MDQEIAIERFPAPPLENLSVKALGELVLDSASRQAGWPITAHHEFLEEVNDEVSAAGTPLLLALSPDAPQDPTFLPPANIVLACVNEVEPFDHAFDLDEEGSSVEPDPDLLARGKQLCSQCPVKADCLNYGVTSLELQEGLFGGQAKQERQAAWQYNMSQRLEQLRQAYAPARAALLRCIKESDEANRASVRDALMLLGKRFVRPDTRKLEDSVAVQELEPDIRELLADAALTEWAQWLVYPAQANTILQQWVTACQEAANPFEYDFGALQVPSAASQQRSEESIKQTLRELANGGFNYRQWYNRVGRGAHNAISFLVAIGESVPEGDYAEVKRIGRQKIQALGPTLRPSRSLQDVEAVLIAFYGLGEAEPLSLKDVAVQYNASPAHVSNTVNNNIRKLKALCGNAEENDEDM